MAIVVLVTLAGDELEVPCADGGQRRYLSLVGMTSDPGNRTPPASTTISAGSSSAQSDPVDHLAALPSKTVTSSSETWEKSSYHSPIAKNHAGVCRHTTSSAARRSAAAASTEPTGTARVTRIAPRALATMQAARAVDPVAIPSSTTITVRPASGIGVRSPRN